MPGRRIEVAGVGAVVGTVLAGSAVALGGCATYSAGAAPSVSRQIVLIQSSSSAAPAVALACSARAQASRSGYRLSVERLVRPVASDQIAVVNAVIASKPAAVVISPDAGATPAASLQSMCSAGITVVEIRRDERSGSARTGAEAVRRAVGALR